MYQNQLFFKNNIKHFKITTLFSQARALYYIILHTKMSSLMFKTQLVDIFSYENLSNEIIDFKKEPIDSNSKKTFVIFYNFHNFFNEERLFLSFLTKVNNKKKTLIHSNSFILKSVTDLFFTAW
jgi:hypothetical protein